MNCSGMSVKVSFTLLSLPQFCDWITVGGVLVADVLGGMLPIVCAIEGIKVLDATKGLPMGCTLGSVIGKVFGGGGAVVIGGVIVCGCCTTKGLLTTVGCGGVDLFSVAG